MEVLQIVNCPELLQGEDGQDAQCNAPAEIIRRDVMESTSGPVEHIGTRCVAGHVLALFPAEYLDR